MEQLFTLENLLTLIFLILLQAVLGFDNLLYISLESKRAPVDKQSYVRKYGIGLAVAFRLILLFILIKVIQLFQSPIIDIDIPNILTCKINLHSIIVFFGGILIMYTAIKEIFHMLLIQDLENIDKGSKSVNSIIIWIVIMNLIFSFDSILSAMALTDSFIIMATAIITGGVLMIWLSDRVSVFLEKNRMYEVLGLFILFVVGIMLLSEGGHKAGLIIIGHKIEPMSKATFYFVISILVLTDIVQTKYQRNLLKKNIK